MTNTCQFQKCKQPATEQAIDAEGNRLKVCPKHYRTLNGTIDLDQEAIDRLFAEETDQWAVAIGLYRMAFPYWDRIRGIIGHPRVSEATNRYIGQKFIAFDKLHHPDVMAGGIWMSRGFATDKNMPDWGVDTEGLEIILAEDENDR